MFNDIKKKKTVIYNFILFYYILTVQKVEMLVLKGKIRNINHINLIIKFYILNL